MKNIKEPQKFDENIVDKANIFVDEHPILRNIIIIAMVGEFLIINSDLGSRITIILLVCRLYHILKLQRLGLDKEKEEGK